MGDMDLFLLEVKTAELTRALRSLCKLEKNEGFYHLKYSDKLLTVSIGRTREDVAAQGSWPKPVFVPRNWAETLSVKPHDVAVTTLRVSERKLWARDWGCDCSFGTEDVQDEDVIRRQKNIETAARILSRHQLTESEIATLIEQADVSKAALWSPDDDRIVADIARAWMSLFSYGIEPSDIRRALHRKSREMWIKPPAHRK